MMVAGDDVQLNPDGSYSVATDTGSIGTLVVGDGDDSIDGSVTTGDLNNLDVNGDVGDEGQIIVGSLDSGTIDGDMNGLIEATGQGEIGDLIIGGSLGGDVVAGDDVQLNPDGSYSVATDTGSIDTLVVGNGDDSIDGSVTTGDLNNLDVNGDVGDEGQIIVGSLDSGTIDGDMNGLIEATGQGEIGTLIVGGSLGGDIVAGDDVQLNPDGSYSVATDTGNIGSLIIGTDEGEPDSLDGSVTTGSLDNLNVNGDVGDDGQIIVGNLDSGTIDGDMNGLIEATGFGEIGFLSIGDDLGGDILCPKMSSTEFLIRTREFSTNSKSAVM